MIRVRDMTPDKVLSHKRFTEKEAPRTMEWLEKAPTAAADILSPREQRTLRSLARKMRPLIARGGNPRRLYNLMTTGEGLIQEWVIARRRRVANAMRAEALAEQAEKAERTAEIAVKMPRNIARLLAGLLQDHRDIRDEEYSWNYTPENEAQIEAFDDVISALKEEPVLRALPLPVSEAE